MLTLETERATSHEAHAHSGICTLRNTRTLGIHAQLGYMYTQEHMHTWDTCTLGNTCTLWDAHTLGNTHTRWNTLTLGNTCTF